MRARAHRGPPSLHPRFAAVVLFVLIANACGYVQGYAADSLGIRTVALRTVGNETYLQGIDQALTTRLGADLTAMTGLVPASFDRADAILEVDFVQASGDAMIVGAFGTQREGSVTFVCRARLRDRTSGRILHESRHADRAEYRLAVGEDRSSAYAEAVQDLSRKILISLGESRRASPAAPLDPRDPRLLERRSIDTDEGTELPPGG